MSLTLVILAAGRGSRFGGNKPFAQVGPNGQSLFEYSVFDAVQAGFDHIVFVVSAEQNTAQYSDRLKGLDANLKIEFVVQNMTDGSDSEKFRLACESRSKPWGTGHALLVCKDKINNPFVVINADDYYGRMNFQLIGEYLIENKADPEVCTLPGYRLENTLSSTGGVNRGVCSVDSNGYLMSIREVTNIIRADDSSYSCDNNIAIDNDSFVSMTFWGFHSSFFNFLESSFHSYIHESADLIGSEFFIPLAVDAAIKSGAVKVRLLPTSEVWKGVTYAEDVGEVRNFIADLTNTGFYPKDSFNHQPL